MVVRVSIGAGRRWIDAAHRKIMATESGRSWQLRGFGCSRRVTPGGKFVGALIQFSVMVWHYALPRDGCDGDIALASAIGRADAVEDDRAIISALDGCECVQVGNALVLARELVQ